MLTVIREASRLVSILLRQANPHLVMRESAVLKPCLVTHLVVRGFV